MDSVRDRMTMRAVIERNGSVDGPTDDLNLETAPQWQPVAEEVPCYVWSDTKRHAETENKDAVVEFFRGVFPVGSTFTDRDQIAEIQDRRNTVLFSGPIRIDTIQKRTTHWEAELRRVGA